MDLRLETTGGFGRQAEVWVGGTLLRVMDQYSAPARPATPGVLDDAAFTYHSDERVSWEQAAAGNRAKRRLLDPVRSWRYVGYGRVVGIMPVVIDFGLVAMEDANWTNDETLIGKFVRVPIDRLTLVRGT